ncbi:MAG: ABC transporter permease [Chloroflexi bacterium]|nr:ABC transporter permease [Chloroflexota bacterium]
MGRTVGQIAVASDKRELPVSQETGSESESRVIRIRPSHGWVSVNLGDLWEYRELLYFLVWRDVKVRYKQTVLGAGWAILQPLLTMIVFSAVFGSFAKVPSDGVPYPIFAYVALLPWNYFSGAFSRVGTSLVGSSNLISKVYFPRLVIPIAATFAGLVDFAIAFVILLGMMVYYGIRPTLMVWTLPLFLLLAFASALGVGLWLAALNVRYRDVGYLIPFLVQIWMYASPVAYPSSIVPERLRLFYGLNPMAGVIEGFRAALLGTGVLDGGLVAASSAIVVLLVLSGALYFRRTEKTFADVI